MTQQKVIDILRDKLQYLKTNFGVKKIALFGSFATKKAQKTSDVDIMIEFQEPIGLKFMDLAEYLEKVLGRKTDILTPEGIKGIRIKKIADAIKRGLRYV